MAFRLLRRWHRGYGVIMNKKRAIVIVIDSMGCGALPDAKEYDDDLTCNTLKNLADATSGLNVPNL